LIYSNHVFVNPAETFLLKNTTKDNYVKINGKCVFFVKGHNGVTVGTIGMSGLQRDACSCAVGFATPVEPFPLSSETTLTSLKLELSFHNLTRRVKMGEDELIALVKERYSGQPMTRGQTFAVDFKTLVKLTVTSLSVPRVNDETKNTDGSITKFAEHGLLDTSTLLTITPSAEAKQLLVWEESVENQHSELLQPDFKFSEMGIGGLDAEFGAIFRRAFASRLFPPAVIKTLGIKHVKGMLLHGPPGTGKTLIARQIGKILKGREPKVVNGPEILNKFVGASEENIRNLFADAEVEYKEKKENSGLHIIIFDEIDAICKQRGSDRGGTGVHDTVVNQLLSKIDGVNSLNNILVIGMTNRKDMIDSALLRPGRLEVHIEIGLPDESGRVQILNIHTKSMRERSVLADDVDLEHLAKLTKNFSGAELEGLVRSACSFALYGQIDVSKDQVSTKTDFTNIKVAWKHFELALEEVRAAFGSSEDELGTLVRGGMFEYGPEFTRLLETGRTFLQQVSNGSKTSLLTVLLEGESGCGKSALAAKIALESQFPYCKLISPERFLDESERGKCVAINKVFEDAYKSPLSLIVIDDIERLLEYVPIGPRFSNAVLQTLLVLLKRLPPHEDRKLMVIATSSNKRILQDMQMEQIFNVVKTVPLLTKPEHVQAVIREMDVPVEEKELDSLSNELPLPIGIKQFLMLVEMARQNVDKISAARFMQCVQDAGLAERRANDDFRY